MQLLGRAYLRKNLVNDFEHAMAEAEQLAQTFDPKTSSTQGHYSLGTVYEEYGRRSKITDNCGVIQITT